MSITACWLCWTSRDRQSRIEVGYGLEGVLTDLQTNDILQAAKPDLQAGHYAQAINGIVDALAAELTHADPADIGGGASAKQPDSQTDAMEALIGLVVLGLLFVVLPIWLIRRSRRRAALYPGGYVPPEVQAERSAKMSFFLNLGLNILSAILQSRGGGRGGGPSGGGGGFSGGGGDSGGGGSQNSW
ncbi:Beta-propeller domains of methanol dehydrogenase type [Acetobacter malorum]|uniref:Beta-propeller domains of methanol dehydrogenase type n=1 Tax=Acetobacter malorum TaxID=178901 RepID=A0A177GDN6_9PROT|nr:Beta-propeller domains of methanol dehydrogenase type [Acetobacter malorum]